MVAVVGGVCCVIRLHGSVYLKDSDRRRRRRRKKRKRALSSVGYHPRWLYNVNSWMSKPVANSSWVFHIHDKGPSTGPASALSTGRLQGTESETGQLGIQQALWCRMTYCAAVMAANANLPWKHHSDRIHAGWIKKRESYKRTFSFLFF